MKPEYAENCVRLGRRALIYDYAFDAAGKITREILDGERVGKLMLWLSVPAVVGTALYLLLSGKEIKPNALVFAVAVLGFIAAGLGIKRYESVSRAETAAKYGQATPINPVSAVQVAPVDPRANEVQK